MKRLLYIIILLCSALHISAGTEYIKVGKSITLDVPYAKGANYSWSYSGPIQKIGGGTSNSTAITIKGIKDGVGKVECRWNNSGWNNYKGWTIVVEENEVKSVTISPSTLTMSIGDNSQLTASISPSDAKVSNYSWSSSNPKIIDISGYNSSANIIALSVGEAQINCITDNGTKGICKVRVVKNPTSISLPNSQEFTMGKQYTITPKFTPSDAWSKVTWSTNDFTVAYFNDDKLVANSPGECTITAKTANGLTATCKAIVLAPEIKLSSFIPTMNQTDVDVFSSMILNFNVPILLADFNKVTIKANGKNEYASISTTGSTCTITPSVAMKPFTIYNVTLSKGALKDTYGNIFDTNIEMSFTTGALHALTLQASHESSVIQKGTEVKLGTSNSKAVIRYTLDGTVPNENSTIYSKPIIMEESATLHAKAFLDGYECPEISREYIVTDLQYTSFYPSSGNEMFCYKDLNPYIELSDFIDKGEKWEELTLTSKGKNIAGKFFISGKRIVFVPNAPLTMGQEYVMTIPEGAVTKKSAPNMETTWKFTTGDYILSITAGEKLSAAIQTGNIMTYWGTARTNNGWVCMPSGRDGNSEKNVPYVSSGYSQIVYPNSENGPWNLIQSAPYLKEQQVTWTELQDNAIDTKWIAGAQTTAVIKDGILKMAGRNDFGQVGPTENMVYREPYTVNLTDVKQVVPTMYTTFALTEDGCLYGWGYNGYGLFLDGTRKNSDHPKLIMKNVDMIAASKFGSNNVAVITKNGKLLTWGENKFGQIGNGNTETPLEPVEIMDNVRNIEIGYNFMAAIKNNGSLWMWGDNSHGQLTSAVTSTFSSTPVKVLEDVDSTAIGLQHVLALKDNGSVWAWGCNGYARIQMNDDLNFPTHKDIHTPIELFYGRPKSELTSVETSFSDLYMNVGEETVIIAKPEPISAAYNQWEWHSDNEEIVTVTERGVISAQKEGETKISLTSDNGISKVIKVNVNNSTGINNIVKKEKDAFDIYDISGRKVRSKTNNTNGLKQGIYIINGKKIIK